MALTFNIIDVIDLAVAVAGTTIVISFGLFNYRYFKTKYFGPVLKCAYCNKTFSAKNNNLSCDRDPCPFSNVRLHR